jgi:hypothetical protein
VRWGTYLNILFWNLNVSTAAADMAANAVAAAAAAPATAAKRGCTLPAYKAAAHLVVHCKLDPSITKEGRNRSIITHQIATCIVSQLSWMTRYTVNTLPYPALTHSSHLLLPLLAYAVLGQHQLPSG